MKDQLNGLKIEIVIDKRTFNMELFRYLLELRDVIMLVQFEVKDERVRKMIENHKQTI